MVMTSAGGVNVPAGAGGGGDGVGNPTAAPAASPQECRLRRRRRLEPQGSGGAGGPSWARRLRPAASSSPSQGSADRPAGDEEDAAADPDPEVQEMELAPEPEPPAVPLPELWLRQLQRQPAVAGPQQAVAAAAAQAWPMAFGSAAMEGRMRVMEDTISLHPDLCPWVDGSPVHFFAVFDGHGGSHVSMLCRDRMHEFVAEEIAAEGAAFLRRRHESIGGASTSAAAASEPPRPWSEQAEEEEAWRAALARAFRRVDAMAELACPCGRVTHPRCGCPLSAVAAAGNSNNNIVGSTAVVALLVRGRIIVANCGDSRAVLCRGAEGTPPVPLSFDHKPNRPDEAARIRAAGGRIMYNNGYRVRGILAMSRAIGDRLLRPEVIAVPEITLTDRTVEDQCLILASDGMWDVINNGIACYVARQCLEDGIQPPADPAAFAPAAAAGGAPAAGREEEPRCLRAAALLGRLALGRGSLDNISIIVVDLKHRE